MSVTTLAGAFTASASVASPTLFNLQVSVQTESNLPDYFVISAYNSTGALVSSSQSQYPAGSLELPGGSYILTATASVQSSYYEPSPVYASGAATSGSSAPIVCCSYSQPLVEYGYVAQQVSGSGATTIQTKNINDTTSSTITVRASLPNGTASKGASVSASVLGNWYWGYGPKVISMYNTTDSSGSATLVVPNVPVLVSAWASLPVNLPASQTTVQQTIAGEKINVTVYYSPTYVSFGGWSLITPPVSSASIVLHFQQPYYVYAYATGEENGLTPTGAGVSVPTSSGSSSASGSSSQGGVVYPSFGPGGIPSSQSQATQTVVVNTSIRPSSTSSTSSTTPTNDNTILLVATVAAVLAFCAGILVSIVFRSRGPA